MKILLITGIFPPDVGGPANFIPKLADYLANSGHTPTVVTLGSKNSTDSTTGYKVIKIKRDQPKLIRVPVVFFKLFFQSLRNDRIFSNGLYFESALSLLFSRKLGTAKIVGDQLWEKDFNTSRTKLNALEYSTQQDYKLKVFFMRKLLNWSFNRFQKIITPSELLIELGKIWELKAEVLFIPNGVDIPPLRKEEKLFDLITVSRLISLKRIEKVIEIASELGLSLAIVGTGPAEAELKAIAKNADARITFFGYLNQSEILPLLEQSRYFALFSVHEGLSFALLEAMAAGTPPIASRINGNEVVISDNFDGYLVDVDDIEICTKQIEKIFLSSKDYATISNNAIKKVKNQYSLESTLLKTSAIILRN